MEEKPLVSYLVLCYNHQDYIEDAIKSALEQNYSPLEIIISDDFSTDDSVQKIRKLITDYKGPHTIITNFNSRNMGLIRHLNMLMNKYVHGDYIALAGGDDISLSNRVTQSVDDIKKYKLNCISYNGIYIDAAGKELNRTIYKKTKGIDIFTMSDFVNDIRFNIHGASKMFSRRIFDYFGEFLDECPTEDSTLNFRGLLLGKIGVSYVPILKYRTHENNLSGANNLFKIPYQQIVKQYRKDLHEMENLNLYQQELIEKRIEKYERLNIIYRSPFKKLVTSGNIFFLILS